MTSSRLHRWFGVGLLLLAPGLALAAAADDVGKTFSLVDSARIGGAGGWDFITFDAPRQRLFISRGERVQIWSAASKSVVGEIPGTAGVHGIALAQDLQRGFTSNGRSNSVTVFGLDDLRVIATIAVPGANPDAILYEPRFKRIYTFNGKSGSATVIDAVTLKVLAEIALGGKPEVAVSDDDGHVFVNIEDTAELLSIAPATNQVVARWPLAPCAEPTGLAIDVAHKRLFSACANNTLIVLDAASGRRVADIAIGAEPDGAAFDAALGLAFTSNGDGTVSIVHEDDPEHFSAAATVPTQARARTLSLDPVSHRLYLVTAQFGAAPAATASNPKPRPAMLPDSFTVLTVAPK